MICSLNMLFVMKNHEKNKEKYYTFILRHDVLNFLASHCDTVRLGRPYIKNIWFPLSEWSGIASSLSMNSECTITLFSWPLLATAPGPGSWWRCSSAVWWLNHTPCSRSQHNSGICFLIFEIDLISDFVKEIKKEIIIIIIVNKYNFFFFNFLGLGDKNTHQYSRILTF